MKGVIRGLYSTPWNITNLRPASYMHIHEWHSLCICIMTHRKHWGYQTLTPTGSPPFWYKVTICPPFWSISMPRTLTNSSYRLNTTDFQFTQYHPQKLSPTSNMVGVMVWSILILRHKASSPCNCNIQFPIYTKFITHVDNVTLNTSMSQYCVISIAPPTGHGNSDKHHPIYMTIIVYFSPYHTLQDDMQLKGEHSPGQHRCWTSVEWGPVYRCLQL